MPIIGAHVGAAGGAYKAIENAKAIGADCIQIFGGSPRQWAVKLPDTKTAQRFKDEFKAAKLHSTWLHAPYLNNLASDNKYIFDSSIKNLTTHFKITEMLGADGLVFHIGSGKDSPRPEAIKRVVKGMKQIIKAVPGKAFLILENAAGGGAKLGADPAEIGKIHKLVKSPRVKVCIDTAHAFEAGQIEKYTPQNIKKFFDACDKGFGLKNLVVMHINDSKTKFNSQHDRHEDIGKGYIGLQAFKNLAKEKRINKLPWVLEVPGLKDKSLSIKNIKVLKACTK